MLAVIIDERIDELCDYTGVKSCSELSLLVGDLLHFQLKEFSSIGVTEFVYLSEWNTPEKEDVLCFSDVLSFNKFLRECTDDTIVLVFSNVYFELDEKYINDNFLNLLPVRITNSEGIVSCFVVNKQDLLNKIDSLNCVSDYKNLLTTLKTNNVKLDHIVFEINTLTEYKSFLKSILNQKTSIALPMVAEGVFATQSIPKGDFVITPPVFFGDDVQIESECVIGQDTIIFDKSLVSRKSCIKSSVLLKDSYVSSGCFIDNVLCCENASIRRNSAVFSGSVVGCNSIISEDTFVENNSYIRPFTIVSNKWKTHSSQENESVSGFYGYTPEKAALLGGAVGTVCKKTRIAILTNGEINATVLKYALVSGLMSTGVECLDFGFGFSSALLYYVNYCDMDYGFFIDGASDGTIISFVTLNQNHMPKDIFYAVKHIMSTNGVIRCKKNFCKNIRKITGMKSIYVQNLVNNFSGEIPFFPIFKCSNDQITFVVEKALAKVQVSNLNKQIIFRINDNGTNVECVCSNEKFNKDKLCEFVAFYDKKSSQYNCEIWRYDAVFLCFKVMEIVANLNLDFYTEIKNMPSFYIAERVVFTDKNIPYLASKLSEKFDVSYNNNSMIFHNGNVKLHCFDEGNSKKIRLLAQNVKAENAEEFATEIINFLQGHI